MPNPAEAPRDLEIGIVNTNNHELLAGCLRSLPAACEGLRWRVTVLDNASTDGSAEMIAAEFPSVRLVSNSEKVGYASTLNQVIRPLLDEGTARYLALLHEDVVADPGALVELVTFCDANPDVGLAGPAIRDPQGRLQESFLGFPSLGREILMTFVLRARRPPATGGGWLDGPGVVLRPEALRQVGLFDERFFIFFEDVDMALRMHASGWRVAQVPKAWITHNRHASTAKTGVAGRMELQFLRSRFLYFQKHRGPAVAGFMVAMIRLSFLLRAIKARLAARLGRGNDEDLLGRQLAQMAAYHPDRPLPHEVAPAKPY
jgi:GT2 family glycosyltransferase